MKHKHVEVVFGERDGIKIGHSLLAVNGNKVRIESGKAVLENDGKEVFEIINNKDSYPLNLKFGRPTMTTNDEIVLASMFYSLFAMAVQLSPDQGSSGISELETDTFKLYCSQTVTGVKFIVVCDPCSFDESIRSSHPGLSSSNGNNTGETNGNLHDFVFIFWCISGKDKEYVLCICYLSPLSAAAMATT